MIVQLLCNLKFIINLKEALCSFCGIDFGGDFCYNWINKK